MSFLTTLSQWMIVFGVSIVIAFARDGLVVNAAITNAAFFHPYTSKCSINAKAEQATPGRQTILHDHLHRTSAAFLGPHTAGVSTSKSILRSSTALSVSGLGWDNEDFLEALGKGSDEIMKANDDYNRLSKFGGGRRERLGMNNDDEEDAVNEENDKISSTSIPGSTLLTDQIERIKQQNDDEMAEGGEMFRKLLERAEQQKRKQPTLSTPSQTMQSQQQDMKPTTPSGPVLPDNFSSLSVEQQAALFRELMFNQQGSSTSSPLPFPVQEGGANGAVDDDTPQKPGRDGRRVGRNRDADAVVNTSDVYLAQLKLDSASRNRARYSGDSEFANQVFADPRIQDIKLHINPYIEEQKKAERELYGGDSIDILREMGRRMESEQPEQPDISYAGPKYKDRLRERRSGNIPSTATTGTNSFVTKAMPTQSTFTEAVPTRTEETALPLSSSFSVTPKTSIPPTQQPTQGGAVESSEYVDAVISPPESIAQNEVDFRRQLRTLEGLLLKHRGGPGFGLGRLQGPELQRLISTADSVLAKLRTEEPIRISMGVDSNAATIPAAVGSIQRGPVAALASPPPVTSMLTRSFPGAEQSSTADTTQRLNSMIQCVEGSIQMFKFSPPGLRESVLVTVRAALLSALTTCNECMNDSTGMVNIPQTSPSGGSEQQLEQMLGYLEGTIQMYKFSPPELQSTVLVSVRAALLSAVSTCNSILADNEIMMYSGAVKVPQSVPPPILSTPTPQYTEAEYVMIPPPAQVAATTITPPYKGNDENTQFLETVYNQLRGAQGMTGKMGLRDNLTATEAQELADAIAMMRSMLVEELDTGIPDSTSDSSSTTSTTSTSTANLYQQMLAKARASKQE